MHHLLNSRPLLVALLVFIAVNLIILDFYLFNNVGKTIIETVKIKEVSQNKSAQTSVTTQIADNTCPTTCIDQIKQATASSTTIETSVGGAPVQQATTVTSSSVKEFFVPFGGGSSSSDTWADVSGLQVSIDRNAYGNLKKVTFEASLHTPTGNQTAYARLFNVTDNHPVWFSEVSIEGGTPQLKISGGITLDPGVKLYQVQMKTQLKANTNLDQARIHITTF